MDILFRADASPSMGGGHLMRCLALAEALRDRGHACHLACGEIVPAIERRFRAAGIPVRHVEASADATISLARETGAAAIVVDGYQFDEDWRRALRAAAVPVLTFSDATPPLPLHADIAVDAAADPADARTRAPETLWLLGPDYVLLRRDLVTAANPPPLAMAARRSILVVFGSTDPLALTRPVTEALTRRFGAEVTIDVVVGGGVPNGAEVVSALAALGGKVRVHHDPPEMGALMRAAGLAVSAGGGTIGELAALGVPTIIAIVVDNQEQAAAAGWRPAIDARLPGAVEKLADQALAAWRDIDSRAARAEELRGSVDPNGADRIADALIDRISSTTTP